MNILILLAPLSLIVAGIGLVAFWWTVKADQYSDPHGDASRILMDDEGP
jgi:cbb3-type cytochrome oxidase maturation protein